MTSDVQRNLAARIAGLQRSTPDARRAVYDELRAALQTEVRAAAPFMPVQTVVAKRRALEEAIIAMERIAARSDPPPPAPPPKLKSEPSKPERPKEKEEVKTESEPALAIELEPASHIPVEVEEDSSEPPPAPALVTAPFVYTPDQVDAAEEAGEIFVDAAAPAGPLREFAPPPQQEREVVRKRPMVLYVGVAAMAACVAALAVLFVGIDGEQPAKPRSSGRVTAVPPPAAQAIIRPSNVPPAPQPAAELIRSAGFGTAAQDSLKAGLALIARGDYDRAIAALDDAIRLDPTQASAFGNRAFAYWSKGDAASAVRDYSEALRLEPLNPANRLHRAVAYNRLGEYEHAIADLNEVIRMQPANFDALSSRCWSRALFDHLQEALADCNEALKLKPKDLNTLDSRGLVYLKLGRLDRAVADYSAALRIEPKLASSLYGRGLAKIGRGDRAGGNEDVAAAKAVSPDIQATFARYGVR